jgi:hypothetical protein
MNHLEAFLEQTWDSILSRDADRVQTVFAGLSDENRKVVLAHLRKMAEESGWHSEQVKSARFALDVLEQAKGNK